VSTTSTAPAREVQPTPVPPGLGCSAYAFARNEAVDARNFFAPANQRRPKFRQYQAGFSLGGPIQRNRTFFFADYEGFDQVQGFDTGGGANSFAGQSISRAHAIHASYLKIVSRNLLVDVTGGYFRFGNDALPLNARRNALA
jgi:hypothetical protein